MAQQRFLNTNIIKIQDHLTSIQMNLTANAPDFSFIMLFTSDPKQKALDDAKQAVCTLDLQLSRIDTYQENLKQQLATASQKKSIKIKGHSHKMSEHELIEKKIAILQTVKTDIEKSVNNIANHFDSNMGLSSAIQIKNISDNDAAILNHSRHNGFVNFIGDVGRVAYGALATLWGFANLVVLLALAFFEPSIFVFNSSNSNCGASYATAGFSDYHQHRMNNYGQFFSSGDTSSYTIANDATDMLADVESNLQNLTKVILSH